MGIIGNLNDAKKIIDAKAKEDPSKAKGAIEKLADKLDAKTHGAAHNLIERVEEKADAYVDKQASKKTLAEKVDAALTSPPVPAPASPPKTPHRAVDVWE